jgi:hypothetical protein
MVAEALKKYTLELDNDGTIIREYSGADDERPDMKVHKIVCARMSRTGENYSVAFEGARLDPENESAFKAYGQMVWI